MLPNVLLQQLVQARASLDVALPDDCPLRHDLPAIQRLRIYQTFDLDGDDQPFTVPHYDTIETWRQSHAYQRFVQLAITTAKHVLPIWINDIRRFAMAEVDAPPEEVEQIISYPSQLLVAATALHTGAVASLTFDALSSEAYHCLGALPDIVSYNGSCAFEAAYYAFGAARAWGVGWSFVPFDFSLDTLDDTLFDGELCDDPSTPKSIQGFLRRDPAYYAAEAISAIDQDPIGTPSEERTRLSYDSSRRYQFWRWWLDEAIPLPWRT